MTYCLMCLIIPITDNLNNPKVFFMQGGLSTFVVRGGGELSQSENGYLKRHIRRSDKTGYKAAS